jgi:predicted ATPase/DNA-binding SARP family transcriptional activator
VATLQLYFLGPMDIRCDDRELLKPPTLKSQSLLAYLVLHRNWPQPRERLADLYWGDRPERKAHGSLSTALWHLRRCLPDEALILSDPYTVQFDPQADLWIDVDEFESQADHEDISSLQAALALYRGRFLDGFYDDWIIDERYRLETLFIEALARLMVAHEAQGEYEAGLAAALRLLEHDPLREDAHQLAMHAYCRLGQRNAALEQYQRCREIIRRELDTEPMVETRELYQAILEGRLASMEAPPTFRIPAMEPPIPLRRSPLDVITTSPLVGRERELAFLQECWQEAVSPASRGVVSPASRGGWVFIRGEAGVGKTRLVEEFALRLHWQGHRVLWGRCYQFERALPYQPVAEALRSILSSLTPTELAAFPGWTVAEVARLVPELWEKFLLDHPERRPGLGVTPAIRSDQERARFFEGVARFLAKLSSRGPILIVLEDLHWAGESSLQLGHYLARQLADHPALTVGTFRSEAVGPRHPLRVFQQQLKQETLARSLRLARLSSANIETIVAAMSGAGEAALPLARRLYQETEGNPFFLMEIVKALFETGVVRLEEGLWKGDFDQISQGEIPLPAGLGETIQARVARLGDDVREALGLAAVLGREFDFDLLNAAWERGEEATLEALDDLLRRRLIEERSGATDHDYAFTHHKIQEVVYAMTPRRRRQHLHGQAGAAMERLYGPRAEKLAGELAYHFEQGRQLDRTLSGKAISYLLLAGDQARGSYLCAEALRYYTRALALVEKAELPKGDALAASIRARRGEIYSRIDDNAGARGDFYQVLTWSRQAGDRRQEAQTLLDLVKPYLVGHELEKAMACARDAYAIADSLGDDFLIARSTGALGSVLCVRGDLSEARQYLQTGLSAGRASGAADMLNEVLFYACLERNWVGDFHGTLALAEELAPLAEEIHDPVAAYGALWLQALAWCNLGKYEKAIEALAQSGEVARMAGISTAPAELLNTRGWVHQEIFNLQESLRLNAEGVRVAHDLGEIESEANALANLGTDYLWLSDLSRAEECFVETWALLEKQFGGYRWRWRTRLLAACGELHLARGEAVEALGYADQCLELAARTSSRKNQVKGWKLKGEGLAALGRLDEAAGWLRKAVVVAEEIGNPPLTWKSRYALGGVLECQGRLLEARREYRLAVDAIEGTAASLSDLALRETFLRAGLVCAVRAAWHRLRSLDGT